MIEIPPKFLNPGIFPVEIEYFPQPKIIFPNLKSCILLRVLKNHFHSSLCGAWKVDNFFYFNTYFQGVWYDHILYLQFFTVLGNLKKKGSVFSISVT